LTEKESLYYIYTFDKRELWKKFHSIPSFIFANQCRQFRSEPRLNVDSNGRIVYACGDRDAKYFVHYLDDKSIINFDMGDNLRVDDRTEIPGMVMAPGSETICFFTESERAEYTCYLYDYQRKIQVARNYWIFAGIRPDTINCFATITKDIFLLISPNFFSDDVVYCGYNCKETDNSTYHENVQQYYAKVLKILPSRDIGKCLFLTPYYLITYYDPNVKECTKLNVSFYNPLGRISGSDLGK
jgi:hypothetical protein